MWGGGDDKSRSQRQALEYIKMSLNGEYFIKLRIEVNFEDIIIHSKCFKSCSITFEPSYKSDLLNLSVKKKGARKLVALQ